LQAMYKLYASLIQKIMIKLEDKLCKTQYAYRKARITGQPLFIIRRMQDSAESS